MPVVDSVAAAMGGRIDPTALRVVEVALLAFYTLGLFAFPAQFWRRACKFICLMACYAVPGPILATLIAGAFGAGNLALTAMAQVSGCIAALFIGFVIYKLAWPRIEPFRPRFNPAV